MNIDDQQAAALTNLIMRPPPLYGQMNRTTGQADRRRRRTENRLEDKGESEIYNKWSTNHAENQ